MSETTYKVMVTNDYDLFNRLNGNRSVEEQRVKKIINSINNVGYVLSPILVNEKMEVVDGQARLEAFRRLEMPVYYIIQNGIGRKECISMNINQTNWTLPDYIASYAEMGDAAYQRLIQLVDMFGKTFRLSTIIYSVTMKVWSNNAKIRNGEFECSQDEFERAQETLSWLIKFVPIISRVQGRTEYYYMALMFCYGDAEVDNDRLYNKLAQMQAGLIPVSAIQQALEQIEDMYNDHIRNKVYIKTNYRKYLDNKYAWYEVRYGNKSEED